MEWELRVAVSRFLKWTRMRSPTFARISGPGIRPTPEARSASSVIGLRQPLVKRRYVVVGNVVWAGSKWVPEIASMPLTTGFQRVGTAPIQYSRVAAPAVAGARTRRRGPAASALPALARSGDGCGSVPSRSEPYLTLIFPCIQGWIAQR